MFRNIFGITIAAAALAIATPADAQNRPAGATQAAITQPGAFAPIFGETSPPIGWVRFCRERPWECRDPGRAPRDAVMNRARLAELVELNRRVNAEVEPKTDMELYGVEEHWTYPTAGAGDCEDYVLEKRRRLMQRGWPESALLITVVRDRRGDGHAVLLVRTNEGDLVLDNVTDEVKPWRDTGYRFVKRQSQWSPNVWVSLPDDSGRDVPVAARR
jgi:predicted transglutaminase-like cysteine proteinase